MLNVFLYLGLWEERTEPPLCKKQHKPGRNFFSLGPSIFCLSLKSIGISLIILKQNLSKKAVTIKYHNFNILLNSGIPDPQKRKIHPSPFPSE
jgi:hypothetical protein